MSIFGALRGQRKGVIKMEGEVLDFKSPNEAIKKGIALVSEDRKRLGLVLEDTVSRNISLASLKNLTKFGVVDNES